MKIDLVDLKKQYMSIKKEIDLTIKQVLESSNFILGDEVEKFEKEFARLHNVKYCVGVSNGTSAIHLALKCFNLKSSDEVIVPANSFIATSEVVTQAGAKIKFVDVDEKTHLLNLDSVKKLINSNTRGIIAVHLYGQMCDVFELSKLCKEKGLFLIEDSAQAHLAEFNGKKPGELGDIATFSFYPGKNLGAYGDAGAIITNNETYAIKIRALRNHGRLDGEKYDHSFEGYNERIDALQCAILNVKLKHLDEWTKARIKNAEYYDSILKDIPFIKIPHKQKNAKHVYHLYVIQLNKRVDRNNLQKKLKEHGINTGIHYPIILPILKAYKHLNLSEEDFPIASKLSNVILSLPLFPELSNKEIESVCDILRKVN